MQKWESIKIDQFNQQEKQGLQFQNQAKNDKIISTLQHKSHFDEGFLILISNL